MIPPQQNRCRSAQTLSGPWFFKMDTKRKGYSQKWFRGFQGGRPIRVPSSWNTQFVDASNYLGDAWYQTRFTPPKGFRGQKQWIRFESVNYRAEVWLNGKKLGSHEGGHLPFMFEITGLIHASKNLLSVRVNGSLAPDRVPSGNVPFDPKDAFANSFNPPASFDFFPFCGIQRPVRLLSLPYHSLKDITVTTDILGKTGKVRVVVDVPSPPGASCCISLSGFGWNLRTGGPIQSNKYETTLSVPNAKLWAPDSPSLYRLQVELIRDHQILDQAQLLVGIRTFKVKGRKLLLNGKPVFLKGFGRHEDDPKTGRYLRPETLKKITRT